MTSLIMRWIYQPAIYSLHVSWLHVAKKYQLWKSWGLGTVHIWQFSLSLSVLNYCEVVLVLIKGLWHLHCIDGQSLCQLAIATVLRKFKQKSIIGFKLEFTLLHFFHVIINNLIKIKFNIASILLSLHRTNKCLYSFLLTWNAFGYTWTHKCLIY